MTSFANNVKDLKLTFATSLTERLTAISRMIEIFLLVIPALLLASLDYTLHALLLIYAMMYQCLLYSLYLCLMIFCLLTGLTHKLEKTESMLERSEKERARHVLHEETTEEDTDLGLKNGMTKSLESKCISLHKLNVPMEQHQLSEGIKPTIASHKKTDANLRLNAQNDAICDCVKNMEEEECDSEVSSEMSIDEEDLQQESGKRADSEERLECLTAHFQDLTVQSHHNELKDSSNELCQSEDSSPLLKFGTDSFLEAFQSASNEDFEHTHQSHSSDLSSSAGITEEELEFCLHTDDDLEEDKLSDKEDDPEYQCESGYMTESSDLVGSPSQS